MSARPAQPLLESLEGSGAEPTSCQWANALSPGYFCRMAIKIPCSSTFQLNTPCTFIRLDFRLSHALARSAQCAAGLAFAKTDEFFGAM